MTKFTPFANESDTFSIGNLTIENRIDRITLSGDVDLTRDQEGLAKALELQTLLNQTVATLRSETLPAQLEAPEKKTVKNPFE